MRRDAGAHLFPVKRAIGTVHGTSRRENSGVGLIAITRAPSKSLQFGCQREGGVLKVGATGEPLVTRNAVYARSKQIAAGRPVCCTASCSTVAGSLVEPLRRAPILPDFMHDARAALTHSSQWPMMCI